MAQMLSKANQEFQRFDSMNKGYLTYQNFKEWCHKSNYHTITVGFDKILIDIPCNLFKLSKDSDAR